MDVDAGAASVASGPSLGAFNYIVTAQKPTSVQQSLVGSFTGPDELNLVVA